MAAVDDKNEPVFKELKADEVDDDVTIIESLCMNCREQGETRLLLTMIPFYKEVVVMSFYCDHCGCSNNELQSASAYQERGHKLDLTVRYKRDLNRQVVKTEFASLCIPEVELEVTEKSQPGLVTTIEGLIDRTVQGVRQMLTSPALDAESIGKLTDFNQKMEDLKTVEKPFHFIIEDCSGNSYVENPYHPEKDLQLVVSHFRRTDQQNLMLGLAPDGGAYDAGDDATANAADAGGGGSSQQSTASAAASRAAGELREEVHNFPTQCPECRAPAETKMKLTDIPHFKEVVIMAMFCEACGHKTNEVKSGGGIEPKGKRIEVTVKNQVDLSRDVLKSETCTLEIPQLELEVGAGLIAGKFTTIEGILEDIVAQLGKDNPFLQGDSASDERRAQLAKFTERLAALKKLHEPCTLVLDDPCGNSYVQNLFAPDPDPQLKITHYERTFEQNEELGINDMLVEGYENDDHSDS